MAIEPFSNVTNRSGSLVITVDRQGRLCLSAALRQELDSRETAIELYVGYDKVNKRIAIAKPSVVRLTDTLTFKFDKNRGYTMARNFLRANAIPFGATDADRYYFDGKENGWLTFKLAGYSAPDQPGNKE